MNEQATRFRVGVFVLASLILLAVLLTLFGGLPGVLKRQLRYTIMFDAAPGVAPGTPVRRSGVRIGEVQQVRLDDATGKVHVTVAVDADHPLRANDQPVLAHGLLGGDTTIDFVPRRAAAGKPPPERQPVSPGTEIQGRHQPDARTLASETANLLPVTQQTFEQFQKSLQLFDRLEPQLERAVGSYDQLAQAIRDMVPELRRTNEEIQVTTRNWGRLGERLDVLLATNEEKLVKTLDNLNTTLTRVGNTFNEENQRNLNATLRNVRAGSDRLESISRNTDELVRESRQTIGRINDSVSRSNEVLNNMRQATQPMAERSGSVMRNLDESTIKLNRSLDQVDSLLRGFSRTDGSMRRFIEDPALYNNLNEAACMLVRILPRMDRVLHDLEVFADKIARHPETLGIRGAVSPSSGLKEAPAGSSQWPPP